MIDVDLNKYRFDYDLTFAALLMHPDGTVYHRYGGRDHTSPMAWMALPSLLSVLRETLPEHARYARDPRPPAARPKRTILDIEPYVRRLGDKKVDCVHCHMVHTAERLDLQSRNAWSREDIWIWPPPERVGISLEPLDQNRVRSIVPDSPAEKAGLRTGDEILRFGDQRILTIADFQWVLERIPTQGGERALRYRRDGETHEAALHLGTGWRRGDPLSYSWRAYKWELRPAPGFGGAQLTPERLRRAGLDPDAFAFEVNYLVDWGRNAHLGRNARRAGIRKGDIVYSVGGKTDFHSVEHFHAWFRLRCQVGQTVAVKLLRRERGNLEEKIVKLQASE